MKKVDRVSYNVADNDVKYLTFSSESFPEMSMVSCSYCDRLELIWREGVHDVSWSMKLIAVTELEKAENIYTIVEQWYSVDIPEAMAYISDNIV